MIKVYRNSDGVWINLSLCNRFYLDLRCPKKIDIRAAMDVGEDGEVEYILSGVFGTVEEAQRELDRIMNWINDAK
jgi:hypothetical protein